MTILYLDTETYSPTPIRHGTARYAEQAEILLATYAFDDQEVELVESPSRDFLQTLVDSADQIVIHHAFFDMTVLRIALGVVIPPHKVRCTMAQALAHSLPGGLDKLGPILGTPVKDEGKALIHLFCQPLPANRKLRRATKHTHPEEWRRFCTYAKKDIVALRGIAKKLPAWNWRPSNTFDERAVYFLDRTMNNRGVQIDVDLAKAAVPAIAAAEAAIAARAGELTDGALTNLKRRDETLRQVFNLYGVTLPDLRATTIERAIDSEDLPDELKELLRLRLMATTSSTAKYNALLRSVSTTDSRLRGALQYCGAARTGRWAGRMFQPQNLPRTPDSFCDTWQAACVAAIKDGSIAMLARLLDIPVTDLLSWVLRGAIVAAPGRKIVAADLSNIEGRVAAWLANEAWKIKAFEAFDRGEGPDLYKVTAGRMLGKPPEAVTKSERQVQGKVSELACGYQGAAGAFRSMALIYGLTIDAALAENIVASWRKANRNIVQTWYALDKAAKQVISANRQYTLTVNGRVQLERYKEWLLITLPSGRKLSYAKPRIDDGKIVFWGINQYSRKWTEINGYGGKFFENICQAVARDVIAAALLDAERDMLRPVLSVHDEAICEPDDDPQYSVDRLVKHLTAARPYLEGLPLAATGFEAQRYRK